MTSKPVGVSRSVILTMLLLAAEPMPAADPPAEPTTRPDEAAEAARTREQTADEDPLTSQQEKVLEEARTAPPDAPDVEPNQFDFYGSLRVRHRSGTSGGLSDGGSRAGAQGRYQMFPSDWLFARAEVGFNLLDEFEGLFNPNANDPDGGGGSTVFRRLLYLGYESPNLFLVAGKTWSTYYQVTSFTDRFFGTGGQASGTYNAGTDGGRTGTGRAERALQTRLLVDFLSEQLGVAPFSLNVQWQNGQPIPGVDGYHYGHSIGLSTLLATRENFSFGIAYNCARVPDSDRPTLRARGIDDDAQALALGARWFDENWYLGSVLSRLENHEATDERIYFDGWGWEVYAQYRLRGDWWLTGGWNWLRPDSDERQAGDYRVKYGVLGVRYALEGFDKALYLNYRGERSRRQDGSDADDVTTIGIRWSF
jgi:outer membrane protein N